MLIPRSNPNHNYYVHNVMCNYFLHPGITVGLMQTSYNISETGGPLSVCVEMFEGNLERNVSLSLTTSDGTAIGMT
jgi:hypothetical protein